MNLMLGQSLFSRLPSRLPLQTPTPARPHGVDETKGRLTRIKGLDPDKSTKKYCSVNSLHTVNKSYFDRSENARRRVRLTVK